MLRFTCNSETETKKFARRLALDLYDGINILLFGEMGAGKTIFTKEFLRAKKIKKLQISSPTYTIAHYYQLPAGNIVHYDLYRLEKNTQDLGMEENLINNNITTLIEWAENLNEVPHCRVEIKIKKINKTTREILIQFFGFRMPEKYCHKIIQEYKTPLHVQKHSEQMKRVVQALTKKLIKKGFILDLETLKQTALLHDLVRYVDFKDFSLKNFSYPVDQNTWNFWTKMRKKHQEQHHGDVAANIVKNKGYYFLAQLIAAHQGNQIFTGFKNTSEKIIYYADLRCKHHEIVSIEKRIADLQKRYFQYNSDKNYWDNLKNKSFELEKELGGKNLRL